MVLTVNSPSLLSAQHSLVEAVFLVGLDAYGLEFLDHAGVGLLDLHNVGEIVLGMFDEDAV